LAKKARKAIREKDIEGRTRREIMKTAYSEPVPMEKGRITIVIEPQSEPMYRERQAGLWKGRITLSPDFDEPLEDLKEYM
jgi:hypothetical protein